ncbi:histidine kinase dimerization/phospho-acceptor domain-containing protein [Allosphingosinicella sp.]|uniref:sensor histidine kinase n=1 Tax=Allosphingosinicella sp. TaxID=2823234 RepID=UPI002FC1C939
MRFDDRFATVMALPADNPSARAAKWRQLVDLLAQRGDGDESTQLDEAYAWLEARRIEIDPATRREAARALAGRAIAPDLFAFFARDHASVVAPLAAGARLEREDWIRLLPSLTPTARALLRHRRDLDPKVALALNSFGPSDFVISGAVAAGIGAGGPPAHPAAEAGEAQIRDLVARIEAFRQQRATRPSDPFPDRAQADAIEAFRWEAGADGVVVWVGDAPRGPLVGQTIASIAEQGHFGVDGQAAGAFEKRSPFRDARFKVAGSGPAAGDWRISGVPFFDPATGSFLGYRGSARRPRVDEIARAQSAPDTVFGPNLPADSLRQLVHELRTPLNAIVGFAEMIDGQYMGPAGANYRSRAAEIMDQASRLLSAVDDLDTAARIETSRLSLDESTTDVVALLCRLHDAYERVASQRHSRIAIEIASGLPPARVELGAAERMFARMLAATIGLAKDGETISATLGMDPVGASRMLCLSIDRPSAIEGPDEAALLDPGYSPDGDWPGAPALGLGFALRLVRNLAEAVGGALHVGMDRFSLYLPPAEAGERSTG